MGMGLEDEDFKGAMSALEFNMPASPSPKTPAE